MKKTSLFKKILVFLFISIFSLLLTGCDAFDEIGIDLRTLVKVDVLDGLFGKISSQVENPDINPDECDHDFDTWVTVEGPTCTEDGYMTRVCLKCFYVDVKTLSATGHEYSTEWSYDGTSHYHQAICEHSYLRKDETQHDMVDKGIVKEVSCKEDGIHRYYCSICGYTYDERIPHLEHKFENGTCIYCGLVEDVDTNLIFRLKEDGTYAVSGIKENKSKVTIPSFLNGKNVTSIDDSAFDNAWYLQEITIPSSVTYIGNYAFRCSRIKSLILPEKMEYIGEFAFESCSKLTELVLPNELERIGSAAFCNCYNIQNDLIIPKGLKEIGNNAFAGLTALSGEIVFDEGLTHIGYGAFGSCINITSVTLPSTLVNIDWDAFVFCYNLLVVKNYSNLGIISGSDNFGRVACYAAIVTDDPNYVADIKDVDDFRFLVTSDEIIMIAYLGNKKEITLPGKIDSKTYTIKSRAFQNTEVETVIFSDGVTKINDYQFANSYNLRKVVLSETVKEIGKYAFQDCYNFTEIEFCKGLERINNYAFVYSQINKAVLPEGLLNIGIEAFYNSAIKEVYIPSTVTEIGNRAFSCCYNLERVVLAEGMKELTGNNIFYSSSYLKYVSIPSTMEYISDYAFSDCYGMLFVENKSNLNIEVGSTDYGRVGEHAYAIVDSLDNIKYLSEGYFDYVELDDIVILTKYNGYENEKLVLPEKLNGKEYSIGAHAFYNREFKLIEFPNTIKNIGAHAFGGCFNLTSVSLPEGLERVGYGAFSNCQNLLYAYIPTTLKEISTNMFSLCTNLKTLLISNGVENIKNNAFYECYSLEVVELPETLQRIDYDAFYNCTNLYAIVNLSNLNIKVGSGDNGRVAEYAYIVTNDVETKVNMYLTEDLFEVIEVGNDVYVIKYQGNKVRLTLPELINGKKYKLGKYILRNKNVEELTLPSTLTEISPYAFAESNNLKKVTFSSNIKNIGDYAFMSCWNLQKIEGWTGVESIGISAFNNCGMLTEITTPSSLEFIGDNAFSSCGNDAPRIVTLNEGLKHIGYGAFGDNQGLYYIVLPSTLTELGNDVFYSSPLVDIINLSNIDIENSYLGYNIDAEISNDINSLGKIVNDGKYVYYEKENEAYLLKCLEYSESLKLPENLNGKNYSIVPFFLRWTTIRSLTIPNSVTKICCQAFYNCYELTSLTIPSSVKVIGREAFAECYNIKKITLNEGLEKIDEHAFRNNNLVESIIVPSTVKYIGNYAFQDMTSLSSILLPESLEYIGKYFAYNTPYYNSLNLDGALYIGNTLLSVNNQQGEFVIKDGTKTISDNCFEWNQISSITIPKSVIYIGENAFQNRGYLAEIKYNGTYEDWLKIDFKNRNSNPGRFCLIKFYNNETKTYEAYQGDVTIPDGTKTFDLSTLMGLEINNLYIPKSVTYIDNSCGLFRMIQNIYYDGDINDLLGISYSSLGLPVASWTGNMYLKNDGSQYELINNKELVIKEGLTKLDDYALYGISNKVSSIVLPESLEYIGTWMFVDCYNLFALNIPKNVSYISSSFLLNCNSALTLTIDKDNKYFKIVDGVIIKLDEMKVIYASAYANTIPEGVKIIGQYAFRNASFGSMCTIPESVTSIEDYAFEGCTSIKVVVNKSKLNIIAGSDTFGQVARWAMLIVSDESEIAYKEENGFGYYESLDTIYVESIVDYSMTSIDFSVLSNKKNIIIGPNLLYALNAITNIYIPKNVIEIGNSAFYFCNNAKIEFEANSALRYIGNRAFYRTLIEQYEAPTTLTYIGYNAFSNCTNLTSITFLKTTGWKMNGWQEVDSDLLKDNALNYYLNNSYTDWINN